MQRARFERPNTVSERLSVPKDVQYAERHAIRRGTQQENVLALVSLIRTWPPGFPIPEGFAKTLEGYDRLGGFAGSFKGLVSLSSCLDIHEALSFGSMVEYCRRASRQDQYDLMFVIALAAYKPIDSSVFMFWLAFAFSDKLKTIEAPSWESYFHFRNHQYPHASSIAQLLGSIPKPKRVPLPQWRGSPHNDPSIAVFAQHLVNQFPCQSPTGEPYTGVAGVPINAAMAVVEPEFMRLFQNLQLSEFLGKVQAAVHGCSAGPPLYHPKKTLRRWKSAPAWVDPRLALLTLQSLFEAASAACPQDMVETARTNTIEKMSERSSTVTLRLPRMQTDSAESIELRGIFDDLMKSETKMMQQYIGDLVRSLDAFTIVQHRKELGRSSISAPKMSSQIQIAASDINGCLCCLRSALAGNQGRVLDWLVHGALAPCTSPTSLLEQLRSNTGSAQTSTLKKMVVNYGVAITRQQRLFRILDAQAKGKRRIVAEETNNHGHENWSPLEHPDWLLIELDGNLLIRKEQTIVAVATISPESGGNSLLQMNMGQVSVIYLGDASLY
jgi:hypothetical protein